MFKRILIILLSVFTLTSCANNKSKEDIANSFLEGYRTNNANKMRENVSKDSKSNIYTIDLSELKPEEQSLLTELNNSLDWSKIKEDENSITFNVESKDLEAVLTDKSPDTFKMSDIPLKNEEITFEFNKEGQITNSEEILEKLNN
jgi:lipoprotein